MADDRERGARPGVPAGGPDSAALRTGPPSVPTRVVVDDRADPERRGGVAPTMVPLARKRAARRTLRPAGSAAETEPMRDLVAEAAAVEAPEPSERPARAPRSSESAARSAAPAPAGASERPVRAPRSSESAARSEGPPSEPASAPTVAAPVPVPVPPQRPTPPPAVVEEAPDPAPADLPTVRTARPPLPPPPAPPVEEPEAVEPGPGAAPARRSVVVPASQHHEFAATSAVLAGAGASLRSRFGFVTWARTLRVFVAAMSSLTILACGLAWGATSWFEAAVRQIGALDPTSSAIVDAAAQAGDQNFLVVGSDTRVGAVPSEDVGDSTDVPGARSDTVMVVHVPADRSRVTVVSFPRDLEIDRPSCERWDSVTGGYTGQTIDRTARVKLNTAYQVGGPRCVTKVVQQLSGLAVNHFLGVDFSGFKDMVDAVDGVPVCLEKPLRDTVLGTVVDRAGTSVLTGDQALNFVRARHVVGDPTSDYGRINRQQVFLSALLRQTLSAGTLLDIGRLRGLVDAVGRSTYGENIEAAQLLALGQSLSGLDPRNVTFTTVPTTGVANARGNEVVRPAENRALFDAVINDRPLPGQPGSAPVTGPAAPVPAQRVALELVDARTTDTSGASTGSSGSGSGDGSADTRAASSGDERDGGSGDGSGSGSGSDDDEAGFRRSPGAVAAQGPSASSVAGSLRGYGFTVRPAGLAAVEDRTVIRFSPDQAGAAATLQKAVPGAVLDPRSGGPAQLALVLADDFDGRVVDPAAPPPPAALPALVNAADSACR